MAEVPRGESSYFSLLDIITLVLLFEVLPAFEHGEVARGILFLGLAFANHAIGVRWEISRYLIPPMILTVLVYSGIWCLTMNTRMRYIVAAVLGAIILPIGVAAYSWIGKKEEPPPAASKDSSPPSLPAPDSQTPTASQSQPAAKQSDSNSQSKKPAKRSGVLSQQILQGILDSYVKEHGKPPTVDVVNKELEKRHESFRLTSWTLQPKASPSVPLTEIDGAVIDGGAAERGCVPWKPGCTGSGITTTGPIVINGADIKNTADGAVKTEVNGTGPCTETTPLTMNDVDLHNNETGVKAENPCLPITINRGQVRENTTGVETVAPKPPQ